MNDRVVCKTALTKPGLLNAVNCQLSFFSCTDFCNNTIPEIKQQKNQNVNSYQFPTVCSRNDFYKTILILTFGNSFRKPLYWAKGKTLIFFSFLF